MGTNNEEPDESIKISNIIFSLVFPIYNLGMSIGGITFNYIQNKYKDTEGEFTVIIQSMLNICK